MTNNIPDPYQNLSLFDRLILVKIFKASELLKCINNYIKIEMGESYI
jgi:hypothetical protein